MPAAAIYRVNRGLVRHSVIRLLLTILGLTWFTACSAPAGEVGHRPGTDPEQAPTGCGTEMMGQARILRFETSGVPSWNALVVFDWISDAGATYGAEHKWPLARDCVRDEGLQVGSNLRVKMFVKPGSASAAAVPCPQILFIDLKSPSCQE